MHGQKLKVFFLLFFNELLQYRSRLFDLFHVKIFHKGTGIFNLRTTCFVNKMLKYQVGQHQDFLILIFQYKTEFVSSLTAEPDWGLGPTDYVATPRKQTIPAFPVAVSRISAYARDVVELFQKNGPISTLARGIVTLLMSINIYVGTSFETLQMKNLFEKFDNEAVVKWLPVKNLLL